MIRSRAVAGELKMVMFDLDGTLVDAYRPVYLSLNAALKERAYAPITFRTVKRSVGWGERALVAKFVKAEDLDDVLKRYRRHHLKYIGQDVKVLPGVVRLLDTLRGRSIRMAIASNRPGRFTRKILVQTQLRPYFKHILCGDEVKTMKPSGEILLTLLANARLEASQAVYVGDMTVDILTGRAAGVRTIAVATGSSSLEELERERPWAMVPSMTRVRGILEERGGLACE